jgi:hypothetical protein
MFYLIHLLTPGYKQRVHLAKALRTRSHAVKNAVARYNDMAVRLIPPRPRLDFQQVMDYVHVGEFDLLRDSRYKIGERPWSLPLVREASVAYFKICRAHEELLRVRIEARRLWSYMESRENSMSELLDELATSDLILIPLLEDRLTRFRDTNATHEQRLLQLTSLPGFQELMTESMQSLESFPPLTQFDPDDPTLMDMTATDTQVSDASLDSAISLLTGPLGVDAD